MDIFLKDDEILLLCELFYSSLYQYVDEIEKSELKVDRLFSVAD